MTTTPLDEQALYQLLFGDLVKSGCNGYGTKRLAVHIPGTISERIPLRAYGFKDDNKILYIGLRLYLDQGNYSKRLYYAPDISISDHLVSLVDAFNRQYGKHFSK